MSKGYYVCQRAAHAIIAEICPLRVSSDALQAINLFMDEFISLLLTASSSLDLVRLKAAVLKLLPHSLGKNALIEAEIELKNQMDSDDYDVETYEKMRTIGIDGTIFPSETVVPLLQHTCSLYSTLADDHHSIDLFAQVVSVDNIVVVPVIIIYITTVIEHMAEYVLNSIAVTADQADAEHIRVKEVLLTLLDDPQVGSLFKRMRLRDQLEKRVSTYTSYFNSSLPSPVSSPVSITRDQLLQRHLYSHSNLINKDDPDPNFNEYEQGNYHDITTRPTPSSNYSLRSSESISDRPLSILSSGTAKSAGSKSRFNFFSSSSTKKKRHSISLNFSSKKSNPPSIISPTTPSFMSATMDFEELIRSGNTKKVTLTPNRLRTIEVREEPWNNQFPKNFQTPLRKSSSEASSPISLSVPPLPPLPQLNRDAHSSVSDKNNASPPLTPVSSVASRPSQKSRHSIIYEERTQKSSRSSLKSYSTQEDLHQVDQLSRNGSKLSISSSMYSRHSIHSEEDKTKNKVERPSALVVKRTSMGSRPPSFHEGTLDINTLMSNVTLSSENSKPNKKPLQKLKDDHLETSSLADSQKQKPYPDMIYVIPPSNNRMSWLSRSGRKSSEKNSQAEKSKKNSVYEEKWLVEEGERTNSQEEKKMAEWLLGNK